MNHFGIINCVQSADEARLRVLLQSENVRIFVLQGAHVHDAASFLRQVGLDLPREPDLEPGNWDGFVDCLWGGLAELDSSHVAILWTDAHRMLEGGLPDLLTAISCFEQVARSLYAPESNLPSPMTLQVFLLGDGTNFPPLAVKGEI